MKSNPPPFSRTLRSGDVRLRPERTAAAWIVLAAALSFILASENAAAQPADSAADARLKVRISWGHASPARASFYVAFLTNNVAITDIDPRGLEPDDVLKGGVCQSRAGGGDVDGLEFTLHFREQTVKPIANLQTIWAYLLANTDADTARRLRLDPGYRPDPRKLTVQMNADGTKGFSLTVDQLLLNRAFWMPDLDVFVSAGELPVSFAAHGRELEAWRGLRVMDRVHHESESSYEQFAARWEDMGNPSYRNPAAPAPGHIVCIGWDSSLFKFGIDRGAGVRNDLGSSDHFRFGFDFGDLAQDLTASWKGQKLAEGLPISTTTFEKSGVRYEVEQFAYPLNGPPLERRGDLPMVLLQKVTLSEWLGQPRDVTVGMTHQRELPDASDTVVQRVDNTLLWEDTVSHAALLALEGANLSLRTNFVHGTKSRTNRIEVTVALPPRGTREFVVKLPSPLVTAAHRQEFLTLDYTLARAAATKFWSDYLARGAEFVVPEEAVNTLFRANLWHALRLPRRHRGSGADAVIDLPYSNFAYSQTGTPWPVNQAVYVDYMIYDLRGYHDLSAEELAVMFRNNQEPNGHVKGFANWGVYTPSMIYAVAKHALLSDSRADLGSLLPQTLRALDWCLGEIKRASEQTGPTRGLIRAPLNDLSHDDKAWAFNQAYFCAGVELLGRVLAELSHPRAPECRAAAKTMREAVERGFGHATMQSPLVQLRDHTWIPYVPGDAFTPRRLLEIWYPTDVDTGPLHLSRLRAIDPQGALTGFLLNDHEDNLYFKAWGMANEPVYNQQAMAYLLRDDATSAIRAFYSMMACAFSHSVFEPVEHRWAWGQYFGPPSTDGAWFELYRHMLIHERDDGSLLLLQATPRQWLEDGKTIRVERAPTYFGPLTAAIRSRAALGEISADVNMPPRKRPNALLVRFRHPESRPMRSVSVNGRNWTDFDLHREWVRILAPGEERYRIAVRY